MKKTSSRRLSVLGAIALASLALAPVARGACCYFAAKDKDINQPGQKAFIVWHPEEKIESFTVQPKFEGNALDFGMVIPTPSEPKLAEMPRDFFKCLAIYTILMPLPQAIWVELLPPRPEKDMLEGRVPSEAPSMKHREDGAQGVKVLQAGVVGSLDYRVIVATNASGLYDWLKENNYSYGGDSGTLDFYIKKKWFFTVMKIDPKQMKKNPDGSYLGEVTPTRFTFESDRCIYPLKITQISVKDKTDALIYVHSKDQMDLEGDLSFMHSYRCMYLTYMLGCGVNKEQQEELQVRNTWMQKKKNADPRFETTKLEWARRLGDSEISVLEDPVKNYSQMGNDLLPGAKVISLKDFLKEVWDDYKKQVEKGGGNDEYAKQRLKDLEQQYPEAKGRIVKNPAAARSQWYGSPYTWYANREAPEEEVKALTLLKGHLQKGRWLTKIRKEIRKDEMSDDLAFVSVPRDQEQDYVRIMPTSPP